MTLLKLIIYLVLGVQMSNQEIVVELGDYEELKGSQESEIKKKIRK